MELTVSIPALYAPLLWEPLVHCTASMEPGTEEMLSKFILA